MLFILVFRIPVYVDVLVVAGGIPSWTTFLREEKDSRSQRKTIEQLKNTPEEKFVDFSECFLTSAIYPKPGFNHSLSLQMFNAHSQY